MSAQKKKTTKTSKTPKEATVLKLSLACGDNKPEGFKG
jgi:hypothetical protein